MILIALKILAILGLVALNSFFVTAEYASISARSSRLRLGAATAIRHRAALYIKSRLDLFLSSCQLGNTLGAILIGAVTAPVVASMVAPLTNAIRLSPEARTWIAIIVSFFIAVALQTVIGEQAPKNIAIHRAESLLLAVAIPLVLFTYLFFPIIWLLNSATHLVLRAAGVQLTAASEALPHTEAELRALLMQAVSRGSIAHGEGMLLANAFEFGDLKVHQIMTPRPEVDYLVLNQPIGQLLNTVQRTAFTRLPLCDGDLDHVVGLIHLKDLFNHLQLVPGKLKFLDEKTPEGEAIAIPTGKPGSEVHVIGSGELNLTKIKRDVLFVPETQQVSQLLRLFQTRHLHLAVVVDEYGSTRGVVTMEDVLEELVGQIEDEFDPVAPTNVVRAGDAIRVSGLMPLHDLAEQFSIGPISAEGVDTLGGYITRQLNRWPRPGDIVAIGRYQATVLTVQQRRVGQVLITPPKTAQQGTKSGNVI